ncbi:MAG: M48 family metalloprotease [Acidimicrobiia bacterium]
MGLDEVRARNRRRIAVVLVVSVANLWLVATMGVWFVGGGLAARGGPSVGLGLGVSAAIGLVLSVVLVGWKVRHVEEATVRRVGATDLRPGEVPVVDNLLEGLALAVGVPRVRAALLADDAPNALAVGRRPADTTIVVTTGLIEKLRRDELEAVLAAEMWAVRRFDTAARSVITACTSSAIAAHLSFREDPWNFRGWLGLVATWPTMVFAELLQRSAVRATDHGADALAVATTRHPDALRRALARLRDDPTAVDALDADTALLWFEPVPHARRQAPELRALALAPSLDERLALLPDVGPDATDVAPGDARPRRTPRR